MTDARIVRTRAALNRAIIKLATEKQLPSITVSELASEAGINRVTFYKHFTTPAEALNAALNVDLDEARETAQQGYADASADPAKVLVDGILAVLDHMERHRQLYELCISNEQDGTIPNLLAEHFTTALGLYLEQRALVEPPVPDVDSTLVARVFAYGLMGAIRSWVMGGWSDREQLLQSVLALAPDWLFPERQA